MDLWMVYLIVVICIRLAGKKEFSEKYNDGDDDDDDDDDDSEFYILKELAPRDLPD